MLSLNALWVAVVGTKSCRTVTETDGWHATTVGRDQRIVVGITSTELVQDRWAEGVDEAQRTLREQSTEGVAEAAGASGVARTKLVGIAVVVVLDIEAVVAVPVVVQTERSFVAVEQVAQGLGL